MSSPETSQTNSDARSAILASIRERLAESARLHPVIKERHSAAQGPPASPTNANTEANTSAVEMFRTRLESVGGHCLIVSGDAEVARALVRIVAELRGVSFPVRRVAFSDAPSLTHLLGTAENVVDKIAIVPNAADLFGFDIGVTTAQAAIAETGTLVLESNSERHRLVSLVPPVHVAVLKAVDIRLTLGEALAQVGTKAPLEMSRAITFITGPSRTADIELTLAIGVHGPKELFVIIDEA